MMVTMIVMVMMTIMIQMVMMMILYQEEKQYTFKKAAFVSIHANPVIFISLSLFLKKSWLN